MSNEQLAMNLKISKPNFSLRSAAKAVGSLLISNCSLIANWS